MKKIKQPRSLQRLCVKPGKAEDTQLGTGSAANTAAPGTDQGDFLKKRAAAKGKGLAEDPPNKR